MESLSRSDVRLYASLLCVAESMAVEAALVAHSCTSLLLSLIGSSYVDDSAIGNTKDLWFVLCEIGSAKGVKENKGAAEAMDGDGGDIVDEDEDDDDNDNEDYDSSDGDEDDVASDGTSDDDDDDDDEEDEDSDDDEEDYVEDSDDEDSDDEDEVLQQPPSKKMK